MSASQIGAALKARLAALVFSPAISVAWPNKDFVPAGDRYIVASIIRAPNQRVTIKGANRYSGTMVVIVGTKTGVGSGEGDGVADAVASHFPADLILPMAFGRLRITATPTIRTGYPDAGFWRTPVAIPYEVLA